MPYSRTEILLIPFAILLIGSWLVAVFNAAPDRPEAPAKAPIPDFTAMTDVKEKKQAFFNFLLPIVRASNDRIREERKEFTRIRQALSTGKALSAEESAWLSDIATRYRVKDTPLTDPATLNKLNRRIRPVPAALVLAQAANESAWGTARFARNGNNFFGIWCWARDCGLVPKARDEGAKHEVAAFETVQAGVDYYLLTLNSHPAYTRLREIRDQRREQGVAPSGSALAAGLINYSERREAYVEEIRSMIRFNGLESYNR